MSKGVYNYYDPEYNPGSAEGNVLLMSVNDDTFTFVIMQTTTKKILVWGENFPESELIHPAELSDILNAKYDDVKAVVVSNSFTVIPKDLYTDADIPNYSKFLSAKANDTVLTNELDASNYVVFKVGEDAIKNISSFVDLKSVFFGGKVLIAAINEGKPDEGALYIHIEASKLHILSFQDGLVRFYNIYDFANPDELMYYVVLVANELGISVDDAAVVTSGNISIGDIEISQLNEHLHNVVMNLLRIVELPDGFVAHHLLFLSGLSLCGSLVEN
jgi:hypothetical protein